MSDDEKNPIIERHCTKEDPWDHVPFDESKIKLIHDNCEEVYPDCDFTVTTYKCLNCGHVFNVDYGD